LFDAGWQVCSPQSRPNPPGAGQVRWLVCISECAIAARASVQNKHDTLLILFKHFTYIQNPWVQVRI